MNHERPSLGTFMGPEPRTLDRSAWNLPTPWCIATLYSKQKARIWQINRVRWGYHPVANAMQRLEINLLWWPHFDEAHCPPWDRLGDCFGVDDVVLVGLDV